MSTQRTEFDEAFADLAVLARRVAFRLLGSPSDADDVAQEALARVLVRWGRASRAPEAWVVRVATNLALDQLRRRQREAAKVSRLDRPSERMSTSIEPTASSHGRSNRAGHPIAASPTASSAAVLGAPADAWLAERTDLARALAALSRRQRQVVALRYLADFSEAEVANALSCSIGTVKQHAHRGLAMLRATYAPDGTAAERPTAGARTDSATRTDSAAINRSALEGGW